MTSCARSLDYRYQQALRANELVASAVMGLSVGLLFSTVTGGELSSVRDAIVRAGCDTQLHPWDAEALGRLDEIFAGGELAVGLATVAQDAD